MTILMLTRLYSPHIGGVEKHVEEVSRELAKLGHEITILTLQHDSKLATTEKGKGVKIIRLPYSENKFQIWKHFYAQRSLVKEVDIVLCHDIFFWYLPFRFIYPFKPVYTTFHGWEGKFPIPWKNKFLRKISEFLSWGNICIGDYLKEWYSTKPDFVSYGGVKISAKPKQFKKLNQCIFIGRLEKDLGLDEYLKAFAIIKKKYNLKIIFVGDGSYAEKAGKIGKVAGFIKDVSKYLKKPAYIFTSSYLTIWQAMIANRPIFALYHNQLKKDYLSQFPGAKYINISSSADELISQFQKIHQKSQKIGKITKQAYNFAKKHTWKKVAQQYLKLWKI